MPLEQEERELLEDFAAVVIDMIARNPEDAKIEILDREDVTSKGVVLSITPHEEDVAFFVGRNARMIKALELILMSWTARTSIPVRFVVDSKTRRRPRSRTRRRKPANPDGNGASHENR